MTSQAEQKQPVASATAAADPGGRAGEPVSTGRLQDGRFRPGVSGNPAGRLRGTKNRATKAAEELLEGEAEALTRKAVELALAGDTVALRLCLERLLPPRKSRRVTLTGLSSSFDLI